MQAPVGRCLAEFIDVDDLPRHRQADLPTGWTLRTVPTALPLPFETCGFEKGETDEDRHHAHNADRNPEPEIEGAEGVGLVVSDELLRQYRAAFPGQVGSESDGREEYYRERKGALRTCAHMSLQLVL